MRRPIDETIVYLEELGLTQYEAKVYVALLSDHPATAYAISRRSGVPHSRVYEVARRLMAKGLVACPETNPDRFSPLSPDELVERLSGEHERVIAELRQRLDAIPFRSDFDPVWNINNRNEVVKKAREIIGGARRRIYIGVWDEDLAELIDDLAAAHERGVQIVFLVYGESPVDFGRVFYHSTGPLEDVAYLGRSIDIVADSVAAVSGRLGAEATNGAESGGAESEYLPCQVIWTKNRGLINVIEGYIVHDFYLAEIFGVLKGQIERAFGANMISLREKYRG
jgi:sugar-specific transcriptional regulator TrmB